MSTFQTCGVWLEGPASSRGQLYVAALRVGHPDGIEFVIMPPVDIFSRFATNELSRVLHHEVLTDDTAVNNSLPRALAPQLNRLHVCDGSINYVICTSP